MNPTGEGGEKRIRGHVALALVRELALGDSTQRDIAERYGYSEQSISLFKTRNADRIAAVQADEQNAYAGLWIADKAARVAAYEADVERVDEFLADGAPTADLMRVRHSALRSAAEELGQLKQTVETTQRITYAVEGVDPGQLR